jgi:hypothetical protein
MTKLKSLTATLAATALVSGIGLAYAQSTDSSATPQGQGAPVATDSQTNSSSTMSSDSTTSTAPADTSTSAPADTSTSAPADSSTSADSSADLAPQADRN